MSRNLGSESWEQFCDRVAESSDILSWRWAAIMREEDEWALISLVIEAASPSILVPRVDRYPTVIVAVEEISSEAAAARLRAFTVRAEDEEPKVAIPLQHNSVPHRVWSDEEWGPTPTGWPRVVVDTGAGGGVYADPSEPLSAPDLPFYPSLGEAVAERVFRLPPDRVRLNQVAPLSFRLIDRRGRIADLAYDAEGISVEVEEGGAGTLGGFRLSFAWRKEPGDEEWLRSDRPLSGSETVNLSTDGVPAEFVAALLDPDGEEVDRRTFDGRFHVPAQEPEMLEVSVDRWIEEGEHLALEYKRELNEKANRSFAETVAAFANGGGGTILVGVDDDGSVVGWKTEKPRDRITDIVVDLVDETPVFEVHEVLIEDMPIIVVQVSPSRPAHRPHLVRGRAMIRVNATTRPANPAQLRNLTAGGSPDGVIRDESALPPAPGSPTWQTHFGDRSNRPSNLRHFS
jgi:hypothetical protein